MTVNQDYGAETVLRLLANAEDYIGFYLPAAALNHIFQG